MVSPVRVLGSLCLAGAFMDGERTIVPLLDFSYGERFEADLLSSTGRRIHDPCRYGRGQFFLLATFRRYLFQLNEVSVALAL